MPSPKDPIKREKWIKNMSIARIGRKNPKHSERMRGKNNPMFGLTGNKHPAFGTRRTLREETCKNISSARIGMKCPWTSERNKREDVRKNNSTKLRGKHHSKKTRLNMSISHLGKKSHFWKGGVSFGKYCYMFNPPFKNRVRTFFGFKCVECEKTTEENGRALDVHHVNYDKMMCCNDVKPLFVALCHSCNSKANGNRDYWEKHYTDIINKKYEGKSYFTEEEFEKMVV
jgi:hypothetical protein